MFSNLDLSKLARVPQFKFYFRYRLHSNDFHMVRNDKGRLLGHYTAKPLYRHLTRDGRVDRSKGFSGKIAVIFIPARSRKAENAKLMLTSLRRNRIIRADGRRNWPAINASAERAIRKLTA